MLVDHTSLDDGHPLFGRISWLHRVGRISWFHRYEELLKRLTTTRPAWHGPSLTGAEGAWEQISEVPTLTIPYAGVWEIAYHAHGNLSLPSNGGVVLIRTALYKNGVIIDGSEAVSGIQSAAGFGFQNTFGQTLLHTFAAQDQVALCAHRQGPAATVAGVSSGGDGRTGVMAHWVSPGF